MAKKWSEVVKTPEYQKLSEGERVNAQIQYFREVIAPQVPEQERMAVRNQFFSEFSPWEKFDPAKDMNMLEKSWVGFGSTLPTIGRGARQLAETVGQAFTTLKNNPADFTQQATSAEPFNSAPTVQRPPTPTQQEIDEAKRLEAPLGIPGAVGKGVGLIGMSAPALLAAPTIPAQAAVGAGLSAIQPVASDESRLLNTVAGGVGGAAGQYVGGTVLPKIVNTATKKVKALRLAKSQNAAKDKVLREAEGAGLVFPRSESNPSALSNALERYAGKASVAQKASNMNRQTLNELARTEIGLSRDAPIIPETLKPLKQKAWDVYETMKGLGTFTADADFNRALAAIQKEHSGSLVKKSGVDDLVASLKQKHLNAEDVINTIKQLRSDADTLFRNPNRDHHATALAKASKAAAKALEDLTERHIAPSRTGSKMLKDFRSAREQLAKIGSVERAMVESTGDIDPAAFARMLAKGKPLTGGLRQIGEFSQATKNRYSQRGVNDIPGGSPLDAAVALGTTAVTQNPTWLALALGRPLARNLALSPMLRRPRSYSPGLLTKGVAKSANAIDDFSATYPEIGKRVTDPRALALLLSTYAAQQ